MNEKRYSVNCGSRSVNARILEVRENELKKTGSGKTKQRRNNTSPLIVKTKK